MKKYFRITLIVTLLLLAAVSGFNWLVNPYLIFNPPVIKGVNELATENYYKQLLFKPYQLRHIQPRSIILGASRAGIAFNPDQLPQPAYNLAVGGASSYINYRLLQEALASSQALDLVILETPFFAFNNDDPNNLPDRDIEFEQRLTTTRDNQKNPVRLYFAMQDYLSSAFSWETTRASIRMLGKQKKVGSKMRGSFIEKRNGQWIQQPPPNASVQRQFEASWKKFLYDEWFPAPAYTFSLYNNEHHGPLDYYRDSLKLLYAKNIETKIIIAPLHSSLLVALRKAGLWATFETWETALIKINESEAALAGKKPFAILDYATVNSRSIEALPDNSTSTTRLQWFNDSAHASPQFGDLILAEIQSPSLMQQDTVINSSNVSAHFAKRRQDLENYIKNNPSLLTSITELMAHAPDTIHYSTPHHPTQQ